ncbi:growth-regulating factor 3-like [Magnolia sinica]|uniref:growth-regulating factor 3-like n=1 Tax=Magnolia sinica TaxID=86752 RepID=UPI0026586DE2|nr:growth-regulating factor 3-like [Magnolia sinica]
MMDMTGTVAAAVAGGGVRGREGEEGVLGLGLMVPQKLARTETFPFRLTHPFPSNSIGPTFYNGSDARLSDLYDVGGSAAAAAGGARSLQPFSSQSPGVGGMATSLRFPFTWAQWQELERQALIYKYMMASVPVPTHLLFPINCRTSFSDAATHPSLVGKGSCFNLRFSNSTDPEPGRCRRTDGKKWRCSRDVAPDQKYCERHMHRGRPRSRKPVEVQTQNNTRPSVAAATANTAASAATHLSSNLTTSTTTTPVASSHLGTKAYHQPSGFFVKPEIKLPFQTMVSTAVADKVPRFLDEIDSDQQWMHTKVGMKTDCNVSTNSAVLQPFDDHLNLNFTDFSSGGSEVQHNDQRCLYLNTDLSSLDDTGPDRKQPPRRFIDAWSVSEGADLSNNDNEKSPVSSGGKLSISSLTLSMSGGNGTAAEDMDQIQMGLSISESERDHGCVKSQPLSWMNSVPWLSPPSLGGPLGEVLQSSTAAASSPHGCCSSSKSSCGGLNLMNDGWGEAASPHERPLRPDSSPTGVLQKTLASLSDSSSSSSPTFAATKSEIALQWLSQSKMASS